MAAGHACDRCAECGTYEPLPGAGRTISLTDLPVGPKAEALYRELTDDLSTRPLLTVRETLDILAEADPMTVRTLLWGWKAGKFS
jgi:hypothetical protein